MPLRPPSPASRWRATKRQPSSRTVSPSLWMPRSNDPVANVELLYREPVSRPAPSKLPTLTAGSSYISRYDIRSTSASIRVPSGIDITYHWRITEDDGDVIETLSQTLLWADNRFDWQPLASHEVTVYAYNADPDIRQDNPRRRASGPSIVCKKRMGAKLEQPVRIWATTDEGGPLRRARSQNHRAVDRRHGLPAPACDPGGAAAWGHARSGGVIPHEISHQVLYQATNNPSTVPATGSTKVGGLNWQETSQRPLLPRWLRSAPQAATVPAPNAERQLPL